jgi:phosphomannomutase
MGQDAPLMLTVSGLRGWIGQSLTPAVATGYAAAFGQWLRATQPHGRATPHVVLGRDSRPSGPMLELAAAAGLLAVGCRVTTLGIATTPGIAIMTEHLHADGGLAVTASHNPIDWNGLKPLRHDGQAPPPDQAAAIIELFRAQRYPFVPVAGLQTLDHDATTHRVHLDRVLPHVDLERIRARRLKVVLDSVNGAGGPVTAMLLDQLGVETIALHPEPTGQFPHPPEPTREHLTELTQAVAQHGADLGLAQDPDADRLALADEQGRYIGEEYTLALACLHLLTKAAATPRRDEQPGNRILVANLSTSRMIDDLAARYHGQVIRTPVGEANVATAIRAHHALLGGEGNGGVILPSVVHVRDSLIGIALILDLLAARRQPLSAIVNEIPRYEIVKDKVALRPGMAESLLPRLQQAYRGQKLDTRDGVRIDFPDRWVHIRPSNTEPIVRIIAEAPAPPGTPGSGAEAAAASGTGGAAQLIREARQAAGLDA